MDHALINGLLSWGIAAGTTANVVAFVLQRRLIQKERAALDRAIEEHLQSWVRVNEELEKLRAENARQRAELATARAWRQTAETEASVKSMNALSLSLREIKDSLQ